MSTHAIVRICQVSSLLQSQRLDRLMQRDMDAMRSTFSESMATGANATHPATSSTSQLGDATWPRVVAEGLVGAGAPPVMGPAEVPEGEVVRQ